MKAEVWVASVRMATSGKTIDDDLCLVSGSPDRVGEVLGLL